MTLDELKYFLRLITAIDTSCDPEQWRPENPFWGHSDVVALITQDCFGGDILRAHLFNFKEFARVGPHFWNRFSEDATEVDLTHEQFSRDIQGELRDASERQYRNYILACPETKRRYELLSLRLKRLLAGENPF
jgi:hypothetical protein